MFRKILTNFLAVFALSALPAFCALELPPDIGADLAAARRAAHEGDAFAAKMRVTTADVEPTALDELIDKRDNAYQRAIKLYEQALNKDKAHPHGLAEFGRFWLARRDFFKARQYLKNAWSSSFDEYEPSAFSIKVCGSRAEKAFDETEKSDLLRALGGIAERAGERAGALSCYREACTRNRADPRNRVSLSVALCAVGEFAQAAALLDAWQVLPNTGAKMSEDFPKDNPDMLAYGLYTLALAKEELGFYDDALALYVRAQDAARKSAAVGSDVAENARMSIARLEDRLDGFTANEEETARQAKEVVKKNVQIEEANIERKRKNEPPWKLLSEPVSERSAFSDALVACEHAASWKQQAFDDPEFRAGLAKLRFNEIKVKELENTEKFALFQLAERSLETAISKFPRFARPHYDLALCELEMHRYSTAKNLLDAAVLYNPNDLATLTLRGSVLLDLGQWEDAAGIFRSIVALDPENGSAHFGLGRALTALKTDEATLEQALNAFARAERLGLRDERLELSISLTTKDGQVYGGHIVEDVDKEKGIDDYVVMEESAAPFRIAKSEVAKVNAGPGLRYQAIELQERYRKGENPQVTRYSGRKHLDEESPMPFRPEGAIFNQ